MGKRVIALIAVSTFLIACSALPVPLPHQVLEPDGNPVEPPAAERFVRIDAVALSDDRLTVELDFVGAPMRDPTSPCARVYDASAEIVGDVLEVGVTERTSPDAIPGNAFCNDMGWLRNLSVTLPETFEGSKVRDKAGQVFYLADRAPEGLVELSALPAEWKLMAQETLPESPNGRWQRSYSNLDQLPRQSGAGRIDLIQSFGGPVNVSGGDELPPIEVDGRPARLWKWEPTGELVLVWQLGETGLALVANEADFAIDDLVDLAESAELPSQQPN